MVARCSRLERKRGAKPVSVEAKRNGRIAEFAVDPTLGTQRMHTNAQQVRDFDIFHEQMHMNSIILYILYIRYVHDMFEDLIISFFPVRSAFPRSSSKITKHGLEFV